MYSDIEFILTKLIKQGKEVINTDFLELANWIDETYDVKTMNIIYDIIKPDYRPRLQIIFEFEKDSEKFRDRSRNFNEKKQQAIVNHFKINLSDKHLLDKPAILKYQTDNLLVVFTAFEPIAKAEVIEKIPKEIIKSLKEEIDNKDIWEVVAAWHTAIFFFYTDKQVKENATNGVKEHLGKLFFNLLKPYDEFNYFTEQDYSISLDSKENFDKNYESSWFYYFR